MYNRTFCSWYGRVEGIHDSPYDLIGSCKNGSTQSCEPLKVHQTPNPCAGCYVVILGWHALGRWRRLGLWISMFRVGWVFFYDIALTIWRKWFQGVALFCLNMPNNLFIAFTHAKRHMLVWRCGKVWEALACFHICVGTKTRSSQQGWLPTWMITLQAGFLTSCITLFWKVVLLCSTLARKNRTGP